MAAFAFVSILSTLVLVVEAEVFLGTERRGISKQAIEQAFILELPSTANAAHIASYEDELRAMYLSLPKNGEGKLEPPIVRYALHRYFVHKHGWYVKGLSPEGAGLGNASSSESEIMKDLAPAFLQGLLEKRLQGHGLQLQELAVFAATLSELIFQEGLGSLGEVYSKMGLSIGEPVSDAQFDMAVRAYFSGLVCGQWGVFRGMHDFPALERQARDFYPEYDDIMMWAKDLRNSREWIDRLRRNPFVNQGITWERAADHLRELMHNFGSLTGQECRALKDNLMEMEAPGTGRLLLSDFYSNEKLQFHESVDYLRNLGVLEEEGMRSPRLILPNYMTSVARCTPFSSYFSVCCRDECEGLMSSLERHIGSPHASPLRIAEVISGLSSDTKIAPWDIPNQLMDRLQEIANHHGGDVPLHGRLFMQWMHHAFPEECQFPHISGTTSPVSQDDWLVLHEDLNDAMALPAEKARYMSEKRPDFHAGMDDLPWSSVEELVAVDESKRRTSSATFRVLRVAMGLAALFSFVLPLARASGALLGHGVQEKGCMV